MDGREAALLTLNTCERQGGWSDAILKKQLKQAKKRAEKDRKKAKKAEKAPKEPVFQQADTFRRCQHMDPSASLQMQRYSWTV